MKRRTEPRIGMKRSRDAERLRENGNSTCATKGMVCSIRLAAAAAKAALRPASGSWLSAKEGGGASPWPMSLVPAGSFVFSSQRAEVYPLTSIAQHSCSGQTLPEESYRTWTSPACTGLVQRMLSRHAKGLAEVPLAIEEYCICNLDTCRLDSRL